MLVWSAHTHTHQIASQTTNQQPTNKPTNQPPTTNQSTNPQTTTINNNQQQSTTTNNNQQQPTKKHKETNKESNRLTTGQPRLTSTSCDGFDGLSLRCGAPWGWYARPESSHETQAYASAVLVSGMRVSISKRTKTAESQLSTHSWRAWRVASRWWTRLPLDACVLGGRHAAPTKAKALVGSGLGPCGVQSPSFWLALSQLRCDTGYVGGCLALALVG